MWVPHPQGVEKGVVVGTVKGGGGKSGCYSAAGRHRTRWQHTCAILRRRQPRRGGKRPQGGGVQQSKPPPPPRTGRPGGQPNPNPKPTDAAAEHPWCPHPRSRSPGPLSLEPGTPKLFGSPHCPANSKGHRGLLWVSLEDIHVTMGVQCVKGCCIFHVCVLTSVERLFNSESSNIKKDFKKFF